MVQRAQPSIGSEFAGHRIDGAAGRGGMGVVYKATDMRLKRTVALKVMAPELASDADFRQRFERESELAASLDHPNIIPIHQAGQESGQLYITMRFVDGIDLKAMIDRRGRLEPRHAAEIVSQVASGLDEAHSHGLVHRDVKPANVLIQTRGAREHVYLTDFGLTKRITAESTLTGTGMFVGTIDYVAPEQVQGKGVDARTDVYSLGAVLFHCLTGQVPYPREHDMAKIFAHGSDAPPSPREIVPDLPPPFDDVIARAMAKDPASRFLSAGDLAGAAQAAAEGRGVTRAERSVARGPAAPDHVAPTPTPPTVTASRDREPGIGPAAPPPTRPIRGRRDEPAQPQRRPTGLPIVIGTLIVAALIATGVALVLGGDEDEEAGGGRPAPIGAAGGAPREASGQAIEPNPANADVTLKIGTANIEQSALSQIYVQALKAAGYKVVEETGPSGKAALAALKSGRISAFPEHVNVALTSFFDLPPPQQPRGSAAEARAELEAQGLTAFSPTPFASALAVAALKDTAAEMDLERISDLRGRSRGLILLGPRDCECVAKVERGYGLEFGRAAESIPWPSRYAVLDSGQAHLSIVSTIDGQLASKPSRYGILVDDQRALPVAGVIFITRPATVERAGPDFRRTVELVQGGLTVSVLRNLVARVEQGGASPVSVARQYLQAEGYLR